MEYVYQFNFKDDCDFHKNEFHYLASLELSDFDDIDKLNKRLKKDLNTIQLNNIDRNNPNKTVFNFDVNKS